MSKKLTALFFLVAPRMIYRRKGIKLETGMEVRIKKNYKVAFLPISSEQN